MTLTKGVTPIMSFKIKAMKHLKIQTPKKFISSIESADKKTLKEITDFMNESLRAANKGKTGV